MPRLEDRVERYKIYEDGKHIGFFNVEYTLIGRFFSADLNAPSSSFVLMPDEKGHIEHRAIEEWLKDRIVPPTRIGIDGLLRQMGLSEYDELAILKYLSGRHTNDDCMIDFSERV